MELKDVAQLFITSTARVEFYWNFYVVMLLAMVGWMISTRKPITTHLKLLITAGYIIFVFMNLTGLWGAYAFAESLRLDLLSMAAKLSPDDLKNARVILSEHSFLQQRMFALGIHLILAVGVLSSVWLARLGDETSTDERKQVTS